MSLCLTPRVEALTRAVTGRAASLFAADIARQEGALRAAIAGRRILCIGAAGSIGSATLLEVLARDPAAVAVLDPAENNLAELVRTVRGRATPWRGELAVEPLDYGSPLAMAWLAAQQPFDAVLCFAALKHVRSERDAVSAMRLLEVNLACADRCLAALRRQGHGRGGVFLVSTDKAADPVNLMGASKRAMELLLWAHAAPGAPASLADGGEAPPLARATSTRFANVAFSDGSLPWGLLNRLEKRQPLAVPGDVRRYLVAPSEAAQLCLLAAFACPHRHLLVPRLDPARDAVGFVAIAEAVLAERGLRAQRYDDERAALAGLAADAAAGAWPLLVTRSDTTGEKDLETFVAAGERAADAGFASVDAVPAPAASAAALPGLLRWITDVCAGRAALPDKAAIVARLGAVVPELRHAETGRTLDARM